MSNKFVVLHRTVNVSNVPPEHMSPKELCQIFGNHCGAIENWEMGNDDLGIEAVHSITFQEKQSYAVALMLNGTRIRGVEIVVVPAQNSSGPAAESTAAAPNRLLLGGPIASSTNGAAPSTKPTPPPPPAKTGVGKRFLDRLKAMQSEANVQAGEDVLKDPSAVKRKQANDIALRILKMQEEQISELNRKLGKSQNGV